LYNTIYADEQDLNDEGLYLKRLNKTFCEISDNSSLYVMEPIPEIGFDVPSRLSRKIFLNKITKTGTSLSAYANRNQNILREIEKTRNYCNVKVLKTTDHLCIDNFCNANEGAQPLYFDDDHLSETGNKKLIRLFKEIELNFQN